MIEAINASIGKVEAITTNAVNVENFAPNAGGAEVASLNDMQQFDNAMASTDRLAPVNETGTDNQVGKITAHECDPTHKHWGDQILNGLESIRTDCMDQFNTIEVALADPEISTTELMNIQYEMNIWAFKQDLFAKCAGGVDRNVDTLLKAQ